MFFPTDLLNQSRMIKAGLKRMVSHFQKEFIRECYKKNIDRQIMLSLLIDYKINVKNISTDTWMYSPLFIASGNSWMDVVKCLIKNGADVNKARTDDGVTPLFIAAQEWSF